MARFIQEGMTIDYTPSSNVSAGDVIVQGDLLGIALTDIPANNLGALAIQGVCRFTKAAGAGTAISAGAVCYWDIANKKATTAPGGGEDPVNIKIGKCVKTATDDDSMVQIKLNQ